MKSKDGFVQAYNAPAAVDAHAQIVVAHDVVQTPADQVQRVPMVDGIEANLGRKPDQVSAYNGCCSKKIDDGGFETPYRLRKQVVEPVFGQIKQARGFRQFLLRGVEKVRSEWALVCIGHNLTKLAWAS